jgi:hypothetical protein
VEMETSKIFFSENFRGPGQGDRDRVLSYHGEKIAKKSNLSVLGSCNGVEGLGFEGDMKNYYSVGTSVSNG